MQHSEKYDILYREEKFGRCGKMDYIVLDMEWNQPVLRETAPCKNGVCMKNEIIQIGAVRLDENKNQVDRFIKIIKPVAIPSMNKVISRLTGITDDTLSNGESFYEAIEQFKEWCGKAYVILIWGYDDIRILRSNLRFHGLDESWIPAHYNLQVMFYSQAGLKKQQYSLAFALETFSVQVDDSMLHDALYDAVCTAEICRSLDLNAGIEAMSHQANVGEKENPVIIKRTFRKLESYEKIRSNGLISRPKCPFCGEKMKVLSTKHYGAQRIHIESHCEKDGDFLTVLKISETPQGFYTVSQQIYRLDDDTREYLKSKARSRRRRSSEKKSISQRKAVQR